ncbi:hypothetical protein LJR225_004068 [Phenylobacterium sp. LjRoot225]|uniref:hypothetical protein n=1 Tax=Phenylobacterium sp. LjRoot225 TaxID=3342285 RepID=UPI003ECF167B
MKSEPLAAKVARRLSLAAGVLGTADPGDSVRGILQRTFSLPEGDQRYGQNALMPMAAPFEPSFSELQPGVLRFTIEPLPPEASGLDRRDEATREMRRLISGCVGREALRWFDERSEPWRGFTAGGRLNYGAFFGTSHDRDGLCASKVYYEMQPGQVGELPHGLTSLARLVTSMLPSLTPLFTTLAAQRDQGGQRLTFAHTGPLKLSDLGPVLDQLGLGHRLPGIMQTIGLVLGGRFDLPANGCLLAFGQGPDGPEFEIYVLLSTIPDLPANFLSLLSLGLSERPRELMALERWMGAFTPEDDVWPGRFSILSLRTSRTTPPRASLYLRPAEFELPAQTARASIAV